MVDEEEEEDKRHCVNSHLLSHSWGQLLAGLSISGTESTHKQQQLINDDGDEDEDSFAERQETTALVLLFRGIKVELDESIVQMKRDGISTQLSLNSSFPLNQKNGRRSKYATYLVEFR